MFLNGKAQMGSVPSTCIPFRECRAKTCPDGSYGTFVFDHCRYAGYVAECLLALLPDAIRRLLPPESPFLVSLHDVGKVSPGFQGKYFMPLLLERAPAFAAGAKNGGYVTNHASIGAKALLRLFGMTPDHPLVRAVAALTGRDIVCGTSSYLYFHGIDYSRQRVDERKMLEKPAECAGLFEQYGVDYVYISNHERMAFDVDEIWFCENAKQVFSEGDVSVFALHAEG